MSFGVGDQVVCVDDNFRTPRHPARPNLPIKGCIYTVRDAYIEEFDTGIEPAILLGEILNPVVEWKGGKRECPFSAARFRPVRKTDISVFTALLKTKPIKEVA